MSNSEALKERDKQTKEEATPEFVEPTFHEQLAVLDHELGYGDSDVHPSPEMTNKLLKERLDLLTKMMRRKS